MKKLNYRPFLICIFIVISTFFYQLSIDAEIYPTQVTLVIRSQGQIIGEDEIFKILDMNEYVLVPLVSLSKWVEIDLDYEREKELLTVYYEEVNKSVQIDFKNELYYDFPEWSAEYPIILEGDFYVTTSLIEHVIEGKVEWMPRRQELIIDYVADEKKGVSEKEIKKRPEVSEIEPDITGPGFSLGSIQYNIGYDYEFTDDNEDISRMINNQLIVHGRGGDWTFSGEQEISYDIKNKEYNVNYPLLNAKNPENNRLIIIGDSRFSLKNTLGRTKLRGLYIQYPLQQISDRRAYTSIKGEAAEGSKVYLFVNDRKIDEKYIYRGENSYHFENVPLIVNRINIFKIIIEDIDGQKKEIIKRVTGSLIMFEENTNEGIFAVGKYNKINASDSLLEAGGFEIKYAPSTETSFLWELGAEKNNNIDYDGFNSGSMMRLAVRPENSPLVMSTDWLVGNEGELVQHGGRINTLYAREDGYFENIFSYVLPAIEENIDIEAGQHIQIIYEKEMNENWLMDIGLKNSRSILNMDKFNLGTYNLAFDYSDKARNNFTAAAELANRKEFIEWEDMNQVEEKRDWFEILLEGRTYRGSTRLGSKLVYELSDIYFEDNIGALKESKRGDHANFDLNISKTLTDNLILIGNLDSEYNWFEGRKLDSNLDVDLSARLKTGKYTSITAGLSHESEFDRDSDGYGYNEEELEAELLFNHRVPRSIYFTAGIKNTYLEDDSVFGIETSLDYNSPDKDWGLDLNYEYIASYGNRENPQQKASIELNKHFFSGLVGSLSFERNYVSSQSEEPEYEAMVSFSQVWGFADGKVKGQEFKRGEHNSYIAGVVYLDENGNKKRDSNETLLDGISMNAGRYETTTDNEGFFIFEDVRTGLYEVGINLSELPEDFSVITESKVVQVRENENIFIEFGLTKLGEVKGQVYLKNNNIEDITLSRIGIIIDELNRTVFTKSDGTFLISDIPLGTYKLKIMEGSLPKGTMITDEESYEFHITSEKSFKQNIKIPLVYKK